MAAAYEEDDDDGYFVIAAAYDDDDGFAIAASSEEEDDDYIKVISTFVPRPLPLPPSSSPSSHVCAATISRSSPAAYVDAEEQFIVPSSPSPSAAYCVDDDIDLVYAALRQQDNGMAAADDAAPAAAQQQAPTHHPVAFRYRWKKLTVEGDGEVTDDDEEEDEDDYRYQGYYDLADRGRARHVKRSSGRRGRTKKASAMGRPRGDVRVANCSVNL